MLGSGWLNCVFCLTEVGLYSVCGRVLRFDVVKTWQFFYSDAWHSGVFRDGEFHRYQETLSENVCASNHIWERKKNTWRETRCSYEIDFQQMWSRKHLWQHSRGISISLWERGCTRLWLDVRLLNNSEFFCLCLYLCFYSGWCQLLHCLCLMFFYVYAVHSTVVVEYNLMLHSIITTCEW